MRKYWQIWVSLIATVVIGLLCAVAAGGEVYYIKYGQAATLEFALYDSNSPWALYETAPATADVNVWRDGGASESADNAVVDEGPFMSWTISAAEATATRITLTIQDASAPPLFMDKILHILTVGHASAHFAFDLDSAMPTNFSSLAIDANGTANAEVKGISGSDTAADNAELMFNGTGYAGGATKLGTSVTQWNGSTNGIANWITVFSTDFATDYNSTTDMWNVDVKWARGQVPISDDFIDTLEDANNNTQALLAAIQDSVDTIDDYVDAEIATLQTTLEDANNNTEDLLTTVEASIEWIDGEVVDILADTAAMQPVVADLAGISQIGDKVVADMDANSTLSGGASLSAIGDKVVADMDANSLLVNWTLARANIVTDLAGISEIGDKVVADVDANSLLKNWTAARAAIVTDLAGISEIGDKVVADMDANSAATATLSEIGDKVVADMDANSLLKNWTALKATYLDMAISDVNGGAAGDANAIASLLLRQFTVQDTNVAVAGTASSFTLTSGKASADAYAWHLITVTDANDSNCETRLILTWTAGRIVTVNEPFSFTPAVGDVVKIWAVGYFRRTRNPLSDPITF